MKFRGLALFIAFLLGAPCLAHVGSPDVYFQGDAGPYHLVVTIRTPPMIPGIAEIEIRASAPGVREIRITPLYIVGTGSKFPPVPDTLLPSKDDRQFFSGKLWLMASGSWQVRITVEGEKGSGELSVPVPAFARNTLPMQKDLGSVLLALLIFLVLAILSILGAAGREAQLNAGETAGPGQERQAILTVAVGSVIVAAVLIFGGVWWKVAADNLRARMIYRPPQLTVSLAPDAKMNLRIGNSAWHSRRPEAVATKLIPDHGHLMHLFLIRVPQLDCFYHLHPTELPDGTFTQDLPTIAAGRYRAFADVVRESGFPDTLVAEVEIPEISGHNLAGDDSAALASPVSPESARALIAPLSRGARLVWEREPGPLPSNQLLLFRFKVEDANGNPVHDLEPYMGMAGHAEFVRSDLSVFAHVHPEGSVSMAALQLASASLGPRADVAASSQGESMANMNMNSSLLPEIAFPYGFPKAGLYRIFVQVKRAFEIETAVFDVDVR